MSTRTFIIDAKITVSVEENQIGSAIELERNRKEAIEAVSELLTLNENDAEVDNLEILACLTNTERANAKCLPNADITLSASEFAKVNAALEFAYSEALLKNPKKGNDLIGAALHAVNPGKAAKMFGESMNGFFSSLPSTEKAFRAAASLAN